MSSITTTTPLANGTHFPSTSIVATKTNGLHVTGPKANGIHKNGVHQNGIALQNPRNHLVVPSTSNGLAHPSCLEAGTGFAQPVQIKRPPFAFRILVSFIKKVSLDIINKFIYLNVEIL